MKVQKVIKYKNNFIDLLKQDQKCMRRLGYIRANTANALKYQNNELLKYNIQEIFIESRKAPVFLNFDKMLKNLLKDDTLIVYSLESFWNNKAIYKIISTLKEKNIRLIIVDKKIDTKHSNEIYNQLLCTLKRVIESNLIVVSKRVSMT